MLNSQKLPNPLVCFGEISPGWVWNSVSDLAQPNNGGKSWIGITWKKIFIKQVAQSRDLERLSGFSVAVSGMSRQPKSYFISQKANNFKAYHLDQHCHRIVNHEYYCRANMFNRFRAVESAIKVLALGLKLPSAMEFENDFICLLCLSQRLFAYLMFCQSGCSGKGFLCYYILRLLNKKLPLNN